MARETVMTTMNGREVEGYKLNAEEMTIFKLQYPAALVVPSSEMSDIYTRMYPFALAIVQVGLKKFSGTFKGKHASGDEIGFSFIRPEHIDETEWSQAITTAGWTNTFGTSAAKKQMNEDSLMGLMFVWNKAGTPIAEELRFNIDNQDFAPESLELLIFGDNNNGVQVQPIAPYYIGEKLLWYMRAFNNAGSGTDQLGLGGLTVGKGSYLNAETIT